MTLDQLISELLDTRESLGGDATVEIRDGYDGVHEIEITGNEKQEVITPWPS